MTSFLLTWVLPISAAWITSGVFAVYYRRRLYDRGFEAGSQASAEASGILIRDLLWLLRSKGATRAEVDAVFSQVGCGRPTCKACAKRPNARQTN